MGRVFLDSPGGLNVITSVLVSKRGRRKSDLNTLLALKLEKRAAISQGRQVASRR